jgi:hypothetical protein
MPEWLKVVIGVVALIAISTSPALLYEWWWLKQSQPAQSQRTRAEHGPTESRNHNADAKKQPGKAVQSASPSPIDKSPSPNLQQQSGNHDRANFNEKDGDMDNLSAWATFCGYRLPSDCCGSTSSNLPQSGEDHAIATLHRHHGRASQSAKC